MPFAAQTGTTAEIFEFRRHWAQPDAARPPETGKEKIPGKDDGCGNVKGSSQIEAADRSAEMRSQSVVSLAKKRAVYLTPDT
ncbi:MAG: hypothetical protein IJ381_06670 [Clostridia bacterium]|nr:hypothetical protein [Clostridia bacterium]